MHCVVRGRWVGRSVRGRFFFAVSCFIRTNQVTAPRLPGVYCCTYCCTAVLMYVLLHCCSAVCSKGLIGGWVEGALRRPWWVGGPFCTWESFCVLWEMNLFFVSTIPASHWCLGVPPSPLLHSFVLYYRTYYCCRVIIFVSQNLHHLQRMIPLLPYVRRHCRTALLLFCSFST